MNSPLVALKQEEKGESPVILQASIVNRRGWDFATGIGSVKVYNLVEAWPQITLRPSDQLGAPWERGAPFFRRALSKEQ